MKSGDGGSKGSPLGELSAKLTERFLQCRIVRTAVTISAADIPEKRNVKYKSYGFLSFFCTLRSAAPFVTVYDHSGTVGTSQSPAAPAPLKGSLLFRRLSFPSVSRRSFLPHLFPDHKYDLDYDRKQQQRQGKTDKADQNDKIRKPCPAFCGAYENK